MAQLVPIQWSVGGGGGVRRLQHGLLYVIQ